MAKKKTAKNATKKVKKKSAKKYSKKSSPQTLLESSAKKPKLLSGGNPQIPKGDGNKPLQDYIKAMPGWKKAVGKKVDAIITKAVPSVNKAVKWNSPFCGMEGKGWFLSFHCFNKYVKLTFFNGGALKPLPPRATSYAHIRALDIYETDKIDEKQLAKWAKQASLIPGWNGK